MRYRTSANVTANAVSGAKTTKTTESAGPVITRVDYNFENIVFDTAKTSRSVFKEVNDYLQTASSGGFEESAVNLLSLILYLPGKRQQSCSHPFFIRWIGRTSRSRGEFEVGTGNGDVLLPYERIVFHNRNG
jgi:hypothetical protein